VAESPSHRARHQRYGLTAPVRHDEEALPGLCSPYAACRAGRLESRFTGRCEAPVPHYGILIGQTCMLPAGGLCL
jgi:hypothetical protein